jgi:hypothetical protein
MSNLTAGWYIASVGIFTAISLMFTFAIVLVPIFIILLVYTTINSFSVKHMERYWMNASESEIIEILHMYIYEMNVDYFTKNVTKKEIVNKISSLPQHNLNRFYRRVYSNGLLPRTKKLLR